MSQDAKETTITVVLPSELKASMDALKERTGVPLSAQVRFGVIQYLETQGENPTALKQVTN